MPPSARSVILTFLLLCCSAAALADDVQRQRDTMKDMLNIVSGDIEKNYYDPHFHGLDWKAETAETRLRIDKAKTPGEMLTAIYGQLAKLQDSHTYFVPPQRVSRAIFGFKAKPFGEEIRIFKLEKDGAGAKAGLQLGDRLVGINGLRVERGTFDLMMLYFNLLQPIVRMELVVSRGTETLKIAVDAKIEQGQKVRDLTGGHIFDLIREAESAQEKAEKFRYQTLPGEVGYIAIPEFEVDGEFLRKLVKKVEGSKAMIVDVRNNPGGYTESLASLVGHFESADTSIADVITRKKTDPIKVRPKQPAFNVPLFILVDSHSFSSAEMFAYHFQSKNRAVVIGDNTQGRVNAARIFSEKLGLDTIIPFVTEITVGRVVFPDGKELEGKGVVPNEFCLPSERDLNQAHDRCLGVALRMARKAIGATEEIPKTAAKN